MASSPSVEFSLIIPTLNERENILVLLEQIDPLLSDCSHEILVVDDNSPDRTWEVVEQYAATHPHIRLVRRTVEKGLSSAFLEGVRHARGRFLGAMDADLSHDPSLLPRLLQEVRRGAEVSVGSRRVPGGGADHWPWFRRLTSNLATAMARLWLGTPLNDPMSGYFVLRRELLDSVHDQLNPKGYKILLEIVTRGRVSSLREVPFIFKDRKQGHSKLTASVGFEYLKMLWDLRSQVPLFRWVVRTCRWERDVGARGRDENHRGSARLQCGKNLGADPKGHPSWCGG